MRKLRPSLQAAGCALLFTLTCNLRAADAKLWKTFCDDARKAANERHFQEATQFAGMALAAAEQFGETDARLVETLILAASIQQERKAFNEAEPHLRRALALREAKLGTNHINVAESAYHLGRNLTEQKKPMEAEPLLRRAEHICKWKNGAYHPTVAVCQAALAKSCSLAGRYDEADKLYTAALRILGTPRTTTTFTGPNELQDSVFVPNYRRVMQIRLEQAQTLRAAKKYKEAEDALKKLIKLIEDREGKDSGLLINPLLALSLHYTELKQHPVAEGLLLRREHIITKHAGPKHPEHLITMAARERLYREQGKVAEADQLARQLAEAGK